MGVLMAAEPTTFFGGYDKAPPKTVGGPRPTLIWQNNAFISGVASPTLSNIVEGFTTYTENVTVDMEGLAALILGLEKQMNDRFDALGVRLDGLDARVERVEKSVTDLRDDLFKHPDGAVPKLDRKVERIFWVLLVAFIILTIGVRVPVVAHLLGLISK